MVSPQRGFANDQYYHVFNRGVEKRRIFLQKSDFKRFLHTLIYYQQAKTVLKFSLADFLPSDQRPPLRFDIISYALLPNHYHLILRQKMDAGISRGVAQLQNSYTKYFNTKYDRVGGLLQGTFRSVRITDDQHFLQVCRYVFLNPYVARLTNDCFSYEWSSWGELVKPSQHNITMSEPILHHFRDRRSLKKYLTDYAAYARDLELIKKSIL